MHGVFEHSVFGTANRLIRAVDLVGAGNDALASLTSVRLSSLTRVRLRGAPVPILERTVCSAGCVAMSLLFECSV